MVLLAYSEATPNGRTVVNRLTYGERAMTRPQLSQIRWIDLEDKVLRAVLIGMLREGSQGSSR
jgi:protein-arginine kinase